MVGTSGAMRVMSSTEMFTIPEGLWCYRSDRRRILMGGALSNGGNVYGWMRSSLQFGDDADVEQAIAAMSPDAHGLTVLPFWAGERSPGWHASARATITGMTLHTTPTDIMRASLEATAYCFASIYARLQTIHVEVKEMIASGAGLLQSPAWLQMMADVLGRPVVASAVTEASSRGAALLALESAGILSDPIEAPVPLDKTYDPDMTNHARYREAMFRQQELYELLVSNSE
jgi:gluconokinase